jgi:ribosomal protein S27AE
LRINWLIVGIDAFQHVAAAGGTPATARKNRYLSRRPTRIPAEKARHHTDEVLAVKRLKPTIWLPGRTSGILARMPAKTHAAKTNPAPKPAPRRVASKHENGHHPAPAESQAATEADALRDETGRLKAQIREVAERAAALEKELAAARAAGEKSIADLAQQLREAQTRLTARQAELEAAKVEAGNLREAVARASVPPPPRLGCPRCGGSMADHKQDNVRARRCEACHGMFFENGELEAMIKHRDEQLLAGKKGWFSVFFGSKK